MPACKLDIFFVGRVIIEVGHHEIAHRLLPPDGLDEMERRRGATMVPLVRSIFTYGVYFATAALVLSSLGFNPMPFLAGAGILGLVIGFGAQSLINDVVSGSSSCSKTSISWATSSKPLARKASSKPSNSASPRFATRRVACTSSGTVT
jgi:hypothetical protein